jgi:hypothetical protein
MAIDRPIPDIMNGDLDDAAIACPAQDALVERAREDPWKEGEEIES